MKGGLFTFYFSLSLHKHKENICTIVDLELVLILSPHAYLDHQFLSDRVPGVQHVVQRPPDRVVHLVQLTGPFVPDLEEAKTPEQHVSGGTEREAELDVVSGFGQTSIK